MKTTKRVLAIVIAALMLAMMVPFAANAATPNVTFTLSYDQPADEADGTFEWTVYQLATLDTETGALTIKATDSAIVSALKANSTSSVTILEKCDAATSGFGTATGGTFASGDADKTYTVPAGIYYVKCTTAPASATLKNNSIVALPYYQNNAWQNTLPASASTEGNTIKLGTKFSNSPVSIVKKVKDVVSNAWVDATSQQQDKDVQFRTFVTTAGSATERLGGYKISDSMEKGLKLKSIDSVKFFAEANSASGTTVPATAYSTTKDDTSFEIAFTADYLTAATAPEFYNNKYIEVLYTCTVLDSAEVGDNENVNTAELTYKPVSSTWTDPIKDTAQVYVYEAGVYKYDASKADTNTPLANAEFAIYATKANAVAGKNAIAVAKTGTDGKAKFVAAGTTKEFKFAKGTYFVKETKAPANYNLNSEVKEITLGATAASTTLEEVSIGNTPSKLPETGGEGTMMFMIIGGSLILLAGVLFVVVMKKRSSK